MDSSLILFGQEEVMSNMDLFHILAVLITLTALFSYVNHRYIGLPITIGVMLIALVLSLILNLFGLFGLNLKEAAEVHFPGAFRFSARGSLCSRT